MYEYTVIQNGGKWCIALNKILYAGEPQLEARKKICWIKTDPMGNISPEPNPDSSISPFICENNQYDNPIGMDW